MRYSCKSPFPEIFTKTQDRISNPHLIFFREIKFKVHYNSLIKSRFHGSSAKNREVKICKLIINHPVHPVSRCIDIHTRYAVESIKLAAWPGFARPPARGVLVVLVQGLSKLVLVQDLSKVAFVISLSKMVLVQGLSKTVLI